MNNFKAAFDIAKNLKTNAGTGTPDIAKLMQDNTGMEKQMFEQNQGSNTLTSNPSHIPVATPISTGSTSSSCPANYEETVNSTVCKILKERIDEMVKGEKNLGESIAEILKTKLDDLSKILLDRYFQDPEFNKVIINKINTNITPTLTDKILEQIALYFEKPDTKNALLYASIARKMIDTNIEGDNANISLATINQIKELIKNDKVVKPDVVPDDEEPVADADTVDEPAADKPIGGKKPTRKQRIKQRKRKTIKR